MYQAKVCSSHPQQAARASWGKRNVRECQRSFHCICGSDALNHGCRLRRPGLSLTALSVHMYFDVTDAFTVHTHTFCPMPTCIANLAMYILYSSRMQITICTGQILPGAQLFPVDVLLSSVEPSTSRIPILLRLSPHQSSPVRVRSLPVLESRLSLCLLVGQRTGKAYNGKSGARLRSHSAFYPKYRLRHSCASLQGVGSASIRSIVSPKTGLQLANAQSWRLPLALLHLFCGVECNSGCVTRRIKK